MPPHLTSLHAEQILAGACENEARNAKRMRLGLDPISQPNPSSTVPNAIIKIENANTVTKWSGRNGNHSPSPNSGACLFMEEINK